MAPPGLGRGWGGVSACTRKDARGSPGTHHRRPEAMVGAGTETPLPVPPSSPFPGGGVPCLGASAHPVPAATGPPADRDPPLHGTPHLSSQQTGRGGVPGIPLGVTGPGWGLGVPPPRVPGSPSGASRPQMEPIKPRWRLRLRRPTVPPPPPRSLTFPPRSPTVAPPRPPALVRHLPAPGVAVWGAGGDLCAPPHPGLGLSRARDPPPRIPLGFPRSTVPEPPPSH